MSEGDSTRPPLPPRRRRTAGRHARRPARPRGLAVFLLLAAAGALAATAGVLPLASGCSLYPSSLINSSGPAAADPASLMSNPLAVKEEVELAGRPLAEVTAELEELIPRLMERESVPGLSIALVAGGRVVWAEGFGTYAALKLCQEGVLELDRPLGDYLDQPYIDDPRVEQVTLRMVLSHTSGFSHSGHGRPLPYERLLPLRPREGGHLVHARRPLLLLQPRLPLPAARPRDRHRPASHGLDGRKRLLPPGDAGDEPGLAAGLRGPLDHRPQRLRAR